MHDKARLHFLSKVNAGWQARTRRAEGWSSARGYLVLIVLAVVFVGLGAGSAGAAALPASPATNTSLDTITDQGRLTDTRGAPHIGPMAQDFYSAFQVGAEVTHTGSVDTSGVALADNQGLYEVTQEQISRLEAENARLQQQVTYLEARLAALEQNPAAGTDGANGTPGIAMIAGTLLIAGVVICRKRR